MSDHLLRKRPSSSTSPTPSSSRPKHLFSDKECLFCDKHIKHLKGKKKDTLIQCLTKSAMETIIQSIKKKEDWALLSKVGDRDLIAYEAMYHSSCRRAYTRSSPNKSLNDSNGYKYEEMDDYNVLHIYEYIDKKVIAENRIVTLDQLTLWYKEKVNINVLKLVRPSRIKNSIMCRYGDDVKFYLSDKTEYIYNSNLTVNDLIESSYNYANMDSDELIKKTANIVHNEISEASQANVEPTWPPNVDELMGKMNSSVPKNLELLLTIILCGKSET
ncbi:unnamed protein product [Owenia fusiformis]|uniref:Uncharacterized protein n=1 Tax=Owenia fusiformis TaxID=6347 RepID=A0A8S4NMD2_OWEFU|nr:unnamed protein product [Owenia fusiformis]